MERRFIYDSGTAVVKTKSGTVRGYIDDDVTVFRASLCTRQKVPQA